MDRLSAVIVVLAVTACGKEDAAPPPPRTDVAKVATPQGATPEEFCDRRFTGDGGPTMTVPALVGTPLPAQAAGHWRWLNLWATWCKPCVEELPRLARWQKKLEAGGHPIDLAFVSLDSSDDDIAQFRAKHADAPASPRLADLDKQAQWFTALGLDTGSPIPIHVIVAPSGHIRCARAGSVRERDFAAIERLLGEP
jgi:thiol-disulfide isomerase/thioredoxin